MTPEEYQRAAKRPIVVVLDNVRSMHNVGYLFGQLTPYVSRLFICVVSQVAHPCGVFAKSAFGAGGGGGMALLCRYERGDRAAQGVRVMRSGL